MIDPFKDDPYNFNTKQDFLEFWYGDEENEQIHCRRNQRQRHNRPNTENSTSTENDKVS